MSLLEADGAVPHAAGSREGGDGCGEHRDDDLNGLSLDERPRLLAQFVKELHDSPPFGLLASGEILALLVRQDGLAADNLLSEVGEAQDALGGQLGLTNLASGLAEQAHVLDVLANLEVGSVGARAASHLSGEDAEVAQLDGLSEQYQLLDAGHHIGEDALDDALRVGSVVVAHVLGELSDADGVSILHTAIDAAKLCRILVLVLVKVNVQHNGTDF